MMQLLLLEGADSIGGTKVYLKSKDTGVLIDFGINYKHWGMYYEEYLKPRAGRGLVDLFLLGLVPSVSELYRPDLYPDDFNPYYKYHLKIDGLFVSHAHMDHSGLIGVLREDLPIYTSSVSVAIMKAMQDSGSLDFYNEMTYITHREEDKDDPRVLSSRDWHTNPYHSRKIYLTESNVSPKLQEFWSTPPNPNPKGKKLLSNQLQVSNGDINGLPFYAFPVDHSIPGAVAYAFETDRGWVIYSGDLRLHGKYGGTTRKFISEARKLKPFVLIVEGTRVGRTTLHNPTEEDVYANSKHIVEQNEGKLVVADFSPRHIERMATFLSIAQETGRTLLILTKDAYLLEGIASADLSWNLLSNSNIGIFDDIKVKMEAWDRKIREKYSERLVAANSVKDHARDFILAFSFWDIKHLLDIPTNGGVYIYSSSEAYGEEQQIDLWRLWNWLDYLGFDIYGFQIDQNRQPQFFGDLHASGHASREDLIEIIREIQPEYLIPVHTENPEFFQEALSGEAINVYLLKNEQSFEC